MNRVPVREQDAIIRATNFEEVCYGYNLEEAMKEACRCLKCKNAKCVKSCPVNVKIPDFLSKVVNGDIKEAGRILLGDNSLPSVCGRVCPQESQCEGSCVLGIKGEPIAIGKIERFVGDWLLNNDISFNEVKPSNGKRIAVIGSGPAGLACATDLAKEGFYVRIFEALHKPGGVLEYGIPEFRLPKTAIVAKEIDNVRKLGVDIETDVIVGRTITIEQLMNEERFDAVFIGSGAGLPKFMNIEGENLNGVVSANEFLTRNNLMKAYHNDYTTPNYVGQHVVVVGGGNVAMDAARTAKRLGAKVTVVYRRSEKELPARVEEVHHAKEEGINFMLLNNPIRIISDEKGWVKSIECLRMELGEPDASGRRSPIEINGSEFMIDTDMVIMSLGTSPNPLIASTTPGLEINKWKCIVADENGRTSKKYVFAGGDAVTGAATVILAMGAGRTAASEIIRELA